MIEFRMFNIASSFLILIAVILTVIVFISLIGWWRGVDNVLFPGLGLVVATPAIIVLLLILTAVFVVAAATVKPRSDSALKTKPNENFEYPNDIFSGGGNGTLGLSIPKDPAHYNPDTDRFLKIFINDGDLTAIQDFVVAGRVKYENLESSEDFQRADEQNQKVFQKFAAAHPMLGRIDDIYQDYIFNVEDVQKLCDECLKLQSQKPDAAADLALRKLLHACDEALTNNFYLMFLSD